MTPPVGWCRLTPGCPWLARAWFQRLKSKHDGFQTLLSIATCAATLRIAQGGVRGGGDEGEEKEGEEEGGGERVLRGAVTGWYVRLTCAVDVLG